MKKNMAVVDGILHFVSTFVMVTIFFAASIPAPYSYALLLFAAVFVLTA